MLFLRINYQVGKWLCDLIKICAYHSLKMVGESMISLFKVKNHANGRLCECTGCSYQE